MSNIWMANMEDYFQHLQDEENELVRVLIDVIAGPGDPDSDNPQRIYELAEKIHHIQAEMDYIQDMANNSRLNKQKAADAATSDGQKGKTLHE